MTEATREVLKQRQRDGIAALYLADEIECWRSRFWSACGIIVAHVLADVVLLGYLVWLVR